MVLSVHSGLVFWYWQGVHNLLRPCVHSRFSVILILKTVSATLFLATKNQFSIDIFNVYAAKMLVFSMGNQF